MTHDKDAVERVAKAMWFSRNGTDMDDATNTSLTLIYTELARAALSAMPPQDDAFKAGQFAAADAIAKKKWNDGCPNHIYGSEWFIAKLDNGKKVVLRELYKGHSYDYTTADYTYYAAFRIKSWMQFPDSEFVPYVAPQDVSVQEAARVLLGNEALIEYVEDEHLKGVSFATSIGRSLRTLSQQPIQGEGE